MRLLGQIILVCLVISAIQGLVAVLAIGIILALVVGLILQPERTVGFMVLGLLFTGFSVSPWLTAGVIGLFLAGVLIADARKTAAGRSAKGTHDEAEDIVKLLPPK